MSLIMKRMWPVARCSVCQAACLNRTAPTSRRRGFGSTTTRPQQKEEKPLAQVKAELQRHAARLDPAARAEFETLSHEEKIEYKAEDDAEEAHFNTPAVQTRINAEVSSAFSEYLKEMEEPRQKKARFVPGIMAMGEEDEEGTGEDDEFKQDDISSTAHANLGLQRDIREYARIAAWEMPLLSQHAKPFVAPGADRPLRFRYTTYLGEQHPAERKVVVEFSPAGIPDLTEVQRNKLIKLVGSRYNPEKDAIKMSCEMFEAQAQNKRYLGDLIETLVTEAKDPTDTFEDVPFDFRHHDFNDRPKFPQSWLLTAERKAYLETVRRESNLLEDSRVQQGLLIDGAAQIQKASLAATVAANVGDAREVRETRGARGANGATLPIAGVAAARARGRAAPRGRGGGMGASGRGGLGTGAWDGPGTGAGAGAGGRSPTWNR